MDGLEGERWEGEIMCMSIKISEDIKSVIDSWGWWLGEFGGRAVEGRG